MEPGQTLAVAATLHNAGRWATPWAVVEDLLPQPPAVHPQHRPQVTGRRADMVKLPAGRSETFFYQVQFPLSGCYQIGPLAIEAGDVFGLRRRHKAVCAAVYVLVLPRIVPVFGYDVASRRPVGEVRLTHRIFEDPTRISGVRRYEPGDPLGRVHWRADRPDGRVAQQGL